MRYGMLFAAVAGCLALVAVTERSWTWLLLWPAGSALLLAFAYFSGQPRVFGKTRFGRLAAGPRLLMLPYLGVQLLVWHLLRFVRRVPAFHRLSDQVLIGRRLLGHERPDGVDHVVDLTCEFDEPKQLCAGSYFNFPILDGMAPTAARLRQWVSEVQSLTGVIYIHCAEGHGRTGLFAAALLLENGVAANAEQAIAQVTTCRAKVRLSAAQRRVLLDLSDQSRELQGKMPT